ncbi:unnamed protein product, partial [Mesorhabditis spiculigera]
MRGLAMIFFLSIFGLTLANPRHKRNPEVHRNCYYSPVACYFGPKPRKQNPPQIQRRLRIGTKRPRWGPGGVAGLETDPKIPSFGKH